MAYININTGSFDNDSNADKIRIAFNKAKSMFAELFNWKDSIEDELDLVRDEYILVPYNPILGEDNEQKNVINSLNTFPFQYQTTRLRRCYIQVPYAICQDTGNVKILTYLLTVQSAIIGGMSFHNNAVIKINEDERTPLYTHNLGNIGIFNISQFVNSNAPVDCYGLTKFVTTAGIYIFVGVPGVYGFGANLTTMDNFVHIDNLEQEQCHISI